jgi:hypothetical protein
MDDHASTVVGGPHDVGTWRGPASRPWLLRIAHGAGFGRALDASQPPDVSERTTLKLAASHDQPEQQTAGDVEVTRSLRMWWLPRARDR